MAKESFRLTLTFFGLTGPSECVFHGFIMDPTGSNELVWVQNILKAIDDGLPPAGFLNRLRLLMCSSVYLSSAKCSRVNSPGSNELGRLFQPSDYPGTQDPPVSAAQVATCINWVSVDAGSKTGRNFIPGVADVSIDNGRFIDEHLTRVAEFVVQVISGLTTDSGTFKFGFWNQTDKVVYEITDGYCSIKPGTQRRREVPL